MRSWLLVVFSAIVAVGCTTRGDDDREPSATASATPSATPLAESICIEGWTSLGGGACAFVPESLRTPHVLVHFAHGIIAKGANNDHDLAIVKTAATTYGFAAIAEHGRVGLCTWAPDVLDSRCWPSKKEEVAEYGKELVGEWSAAEVALAKEVGAPFERRYALGFSNGGFFVSYVAVDGLLPLDGAAIVGAGRTDVDEAKMTKRPIPMYIGVGADEATFTLESASTLAHVLAEHGWAVDAHIHAGRGHELSEDDFDHAWIAWSP